MTIWIWKLKEKGTQSKMQLESKSHKENVSLLNAECTLPERGLSKQGWSVGIPKYKIGDHVRILNGHLKGCEFVIHTFRAEHLACLSEYAPYGILCEGHTLYYAEREIQKVAIRRKEIE